MEVPEIQPSPNWALPSIPDLVGTQSALLGPIRTLEPHVVAIKGMARVD